MQLKSIAAAIVLAFSLGQTANAAPPVRQSNEDMVARSVFQVLLGEMALQRGAPQLASDAWADLAERSRDPKVIARAVEVAGMAGQPERARHLIEIWLAVEPDSVKARQTEAALMIQDGHLDQLPARLSALLEQDKANLPGNLLHLNRMLFRVKDKQAAQRLVDDVTTNYLALPEARFARAQAALAAGDDSRAIAETKAARKLRPDWEVAAIAHAQLQARQSPANAVTELASFVDNNPTARDARTALARLLVGEKRYGDARKQYGILLKDAPNDPSLLYPSAMLALQQGDREQGKQQIGQLLAGDFPDKDTLHFLLGQIAQESGDGTTALREFALVQNGERLVAARARSAQILLEQGRAEEARGMLQEMRGVNAAERTQLTLSEAQLLRDAGRHEEAYQVLEKALSKQPDDVELLYDTALNADRIGKFERMETLLQHLLKLRPEHPHALNALGYSLADRNTRLHEADKLIAKARALLPEDPFIMDSQGWVQYRLGKLKEALNTLQQAYAIKADPEIAAHLGEVLWKSGKQAEARTMWQSALKKHPDNATLQETLKKFAP